MNEPCEQALNQKNQQIIHMVIERVKRDFYEDIPIVGLTGSFARGDHHAKSDLDLILINDTDKAWDIGESFILDDVGYDIYCTPWNTRIQAQSTLESPHVSSLIDLKVLYARSEQDLEKLRAYQNQALEALAAPLGPHSLARAQQHMDQAKQSFAEVFLKNEIGPVRYAAFMLVYHLINMLFSLNNDCIRRGTKHYMEEISRLAHKPAHFEAQCLRILGSQTIEALRDTTTQMLQDAQGLMDAVRRETVPQPIPTYDTLRGTYEELWCNCHNKLCSSVHSHNPLYMGLSAIGAQGYLDEMEQEFGTPHFSLMEHFDVHHPETLLSAFLAIEEAYRAQYDAVGRTVLHFDTFEQLYDHFMGQPH